MKPDEGYEETERLIKRLEARIRDEYKQANKEVLDKYNDYMRRFKIKDDIKRQAVEAGVLKKEDYIKWRKQQITVGKRWKALVDQLADDYHLANAKAVSISQGYQAEAYAVNHNFATYSIEQQARIDTSYTLYNRDTVERMIRDDPELLPPPKPGGETARKLAENKDLIWNRQKISSAIVQGVLQGESIPKIANRLEAVGEMNHKAAIRNARTMMTGAQNAGRVAAMRRAKEMGICVVNVWSAALDMRTRHEHRELDGQKREVGEPFVVPSSGEKILYPGDPDAAAHLLYNCRCALVPQIKGFEYDIRNDPNLDLSQIEGMTYAQWKANKTEKPNKITLPEEKAAAIKGSYVADYKALRIATWIKRQAKR